MSRTWTRNDARWRALNPYQRAAAMALMEADGMNPQDARNALGAMINRAAKTGEDLGEHVSKAIYQPTIEPAQQKRLDRILRSGEFHNLTSWAERRTAGHEPDPVQGATHFLAPEKTMLALERQNPRKYRNWGPRGANWTGYDPSTGEYKGVVMRDRSHAFLAPEGAFSVPGREQQVNVAQNGAISGGVRPSELPQAVAASAPSAFAASTPSVPPVTAGLSTHAPVANPAVGGGLLSGLFGSQSFTPVMAQQPEASPIPKTPDVPQLQPVQRPIDMSRLAAIIARRQQQPLGVS